MILLFNGFKKERVNQISIYFKTMKTQFSSVKKPQRTADGFSMAKAMASAFIEDISTIKRERDNRPVQDESMETPIAPQMTMASKVVADATATGNYTAPSDMSSLAPSQLNSGNGRSFFIEIGADLTADLPPISGDPLAGGGLQTGDQFQQIPFAPTYTISTARIKEQVGCLDRSKYYTSWKIALDTAYIQRDTTLAPDATTYPTNPNRSSLATKAEPVYLCSEQLQNACGNSRYFTRFGQAEITEGLYTTAFARFNRELPSEISFQFPCALDFIPDNVQKYYANSPRIEGTRDLSNGRPMSAPYLENQFIKRFSIRFIVTVDIGLNALPVYGRVLSAETGGHVLGNTPGVNFQGAGETAGGSSTGRAQVESAESGYNAIVSRQADVLKTAQGHIDELRKISQAQAVKDFASIGGSKGNKILGAINSLAGAASAAISQATMIASMTGAGGVGGQRLGGSAQVSNLIPAVVGEAEGDASSILGSMPSDLTDLVSSFPSLPSVPSGSFSSTSTASTVLRIPPEEIPSLNLEAVKSFKSTSDLGGSAFSSARTDISRDVPSFLSGEEPPQFVTTPPSAAPTVPLRNVFTATGTGTGTGLSIGDVGGGIVSFEEMPATQDPLSKIVNPFSGTGFRTETVSRVQASRDLFQARSFYDFVENGAEFPAQGIGRPSAVRVDFAERLRNTLIRQMPGGAGADRRIDPNKLAEAISTYTRQSGGFVPTRANVNFLVEKISENYFRLI